MLAKGNWEETIYHKLNELIVKHQDQQQYVVFDWDNTCIINDIGEAVFNYQLRELAFDLTPEELGCLLVEGLPKERFNDKWVNAEGQPLNVALLAVDIVASYKKLYQADAEHRVEGLANIKESLPYREFITKLRFLYDAIGESFSADISYPWVTYFLGGKKAEAIDGLVKETLGTELKTELSYETWTSPAYDSQSGQVSVRFKRGIRLIPEIQNLIAVFREKGIAVYIVSASNREVILPFATGQQFGYQLPTEHIYGMRLKEKEGKMLPELDDCFVQTQGRGKTATIKDLIARNYQGRGPIMVAGDSDGDVAMLADFPETELALIIDRQKMGRVGQLVEIGRETVGQINQRFYVQGRDENEGRYVNAQESKLLKE